MLSYGWTRRWSASWRFGGDEVVWPVRDLASAPAPLSSEEQRLLLALDVLRVAEVLSQPFRLDFEHMDGCARHTPETDHRRGRAH